MNIKQLIADIDERTNQLESLQSLLKQIQDKCKHEWTDPISDDLVVKAYTDPGDTPGTMGVDFRGPCYVPESRTKRWRRYCPLCDKTEFTQNIKVEKKDIPVFL